MKIRRKVTTAILTAVMLLSPVMEISASSLSDAQKEKENLEKQLEEAQGVIDGLKDSKADIQTKVKELDQQLTSISLEITNTQAQLEEKSAEITDTQSELEDAQADVASQAEAMSKRIQFMYENSGKMSYLEAFFRSGSMTEFLNQAEYIRQISEYDRDMLQQYNDSVQTVADAKEQLEQQYTELEELKAQVESQQQTVQALMDAKEDELDKVKSDITVAQSDADAVQAEIDAQNEIIAQIQAEEARKKAEEEKRRQEAEENGTTPDTTPGDVYGGGAFVWPCPSSTRVTSDYGTRLSPTQGASSNHKGLDIGASYGASIVAAADGTVSYAGYNNGMGNYVMISHAGGKMTVYGHLTSLTVSSGQSVSRGQVIGYVGSTGNSTGPHLHYECRLNGVRYNPMSEYPYM